MDNEHWELVDRDTVPEGVEVIPSVWSMKRKRDLVSNIITKYKARLNLHGGKQEYGVNFFETYAPVVTWTAIRLCLILAIINSWHLRQIDFVMAYPQAPIEMDMYMGLPHGITTWVGSAKDKCLKLIRNIYGQKQAGRVWYKYLRQHLLEMNFVPSQVDDCVYFRGDVIFIVYVDDGILISPNDSHIDKIIKELQERKLNIEDQGYPSDYVGVNINRLDSDTIELTQPALIQSILRDIGFGPNTSTKPVPAASSRILHYHHDSPDFDGHFNYRSAIGKLNYVAQLTHPEIAFAVHACARFSTCPKKEHGEAVEYIARYLKTVADQGIKLHPRRNQGFECYADADFSGNWMKEYAQFDPTTAKSRSGWVILYANCPILWASKLQGQVALSTTEAEYISLSTALRDVLPLMELCNEMHAHGFDTYHDKPRVYCKAFEDNSGALELARLPKMRPRTKHINCSYHHFREAVRKGEVSIFPCDTLDMLADMLTKPLPQNLLVKHRKRVTGT